MSSDASPLTGDGQSKRYILIELLKPNDEWLLFPVEKRREFLTALDQGIKLFEAQGLQSELFLNTPEGHLRDDWRVVIVFRFPNKELFDKFRVGIVDLNSGSVVEAGRDFLKKIHVRRVWGEIEANRNPGTEWLENVV